MSGLQIYSYRTETAMAHAAAEYLAQRIRELAATNEQVPIIFATGVSQFAVLRDLTRLPNVPWRQVVGFHMDEYLGLPATHPASFRHYLRTELVNRVPLRAFHYIEGDADKGEEIALQYAGRLREDDPLLCLGGIGENGHIAFNDPHEADFSDPKDVKVVALDQESRQQQVNENWFPSIDEVPTKAVTITIPTIMRVPELIFFVVGKRKREVLQRTLEGPISTECPASVLRQHPNARLYVDTDALPPAGSAR